MCEVRVLVVGEGGVGGADGDGEQEHVLRVRLAGQRGEQILCVLWPCRRDRRVRNASWNNWFPVGGGSPTSAPGLSWSRSSSWKKKGTCESGWRGAESTHAFTFSSRSAAPPSSSFCPVSSFPPAPGSPSGFFFVASAWPGFGAGFRGGFFLLGSSLPFPFFPFFPFSFSSLVGPAD